MSAHFDEVMGELGAQLSPAGGNAEGALIQAGMIRLSGRPASSFSPLAASRALAKAVAGRADELDVAHFKF